MLIECQNCQKKLNIPNEKIPEGRPFTFTCPGCKVKNSITITLPVAEQPPVQEGVVPSQSEAQAPLPPSHGEMAGNNNSVDDDPRFAPAPTPPPVPQIVMSNLSIKEIGNVASTEVSDTMEGLKMAMVAFDNEDVQNVLTDKLSTMGYKVVVSMNVRDAVKQLRFGRFQVLVIQEDYYGATLSSNQLIRAVNSLELSVRHNMFVAVVGPSFTSLDDLTAFSLSLDTVINIEDLVDIERILISGIAHVQKFYATYREMLEMRGQN